MVTLDCPLIFNWNTKELTKALCAQTDLTTEGHLCEALGDLRDLKISVCILYFFPLGSFYFSREVSCVFCLESITLVATTWR